MKEILLFIALNNYKQFSYRYMYNTRENLNIGSNNVCDMLSQFIWLDLLIIYDYVGTLGNVPNTFFELSTYIIIMYQGIFRSIIFFYTSI